MIEQDLKDSTQFILNALTSRTRSKEEWEYIIKCMHKTIQDINQINDYDILPDKFINNGFKFIEKTNRLEDVE